MPIIAIIIMPPQLRVRGDLYCIPVTEFQLNPPQSYVGSGSSSYWTHQQQIVFLSTHPVSIILVKVFSTLNITYRSTYMHCPISLFNQRDKH